MSLYGTPPRFPRAGAASAGPAPSASPRSWGARLLAPCARGLAGRTAASPSARFASPAARAPGGALAGLGARLSARRVPLPRHERAPQQPTLPRERGACLQADR